MTETRRNVFIVAAGAVVLIGLGVAYLFWASNRVDGDIADREARAQASISEFEDSIVTPPATPAPRPTPGDVFATETGPVAQPGEVVVVNRVPGDDYGRLAIRHADGTRTLLDRKCLRVHVAGGNGVCLSEDEGTIVPQYTATFFQANAEGNPYIKSYPSVLPSRVRVSPDGSLMSSTGFVEGSSYEDIAGETSTVVIVDSFEGNSLLGVNQFPVDSDDGRYENENRKFWGVSFVDNDRFYVTGLYGGTPEIMRGSLDEGVLSPTGYLGSCPSLSPDGATLVFKQAREDGDFDLVAVDLESGDLWILNETRSVDDQVEWLDDDTILYALHPDGEEGQAVQPLFDIWKLDLAPGSEPELFLPAADSPAVIR